MDLWRILRRDALRNMQPLAVLAVLAAALNLALLTSLNSALVIMDDPEGLQRLLFIFLLSAFSWRFAQGWMMSAASKRMQAALAVLRVDLLRRAVAADLPDVMAVGSTRLAQVAGPELQLLAQAAPTLVISFQSVSAILLCLLYLATLSNAVVLIVLGFLTVGGLLVGRSVLRLERLSEAIHEAEGALTKRSDHRVGVLLPGDDARFLNHADGPSIGRSDPGDWRRFIARRDIAAGEEITCNYEDICADVREAGAALYLTGSPTGSAG